MASRLAELAGGLSLATDLGAGVPPESALRTAILAEGIARVLPRARQRNVILAIEPEPGLFIQTADEYLEFKNRFFKSEPAVLMNCDIGHLFCVGDDPADVVRRLAEHVAHVHLEDIGANRVHQHLTPGKGAIDFRSVFDALNAIGYVGWVTVELYPYETTAAGVAKLAWEHLQPILAAGTSDR